MFNIESRAIHIALIGLIGSHSLAYAPFPYPIDRFDYMLIYFTAPSLLTN